MSKSGYVGEVFSEAAAKRLNLTSKSGHARACGISPVSEISGGVASTGLGCPTRHRSAPLCASGVQYTGWIGVPKLGIQGGRTLSSETQFSVEKTRGGDLSATRSRRLYRCLRVMADVVHRQLVSWPVALYRRAVDSSLTFVTLLHRNKLPRDTCISFECGGGLHELRTTYELVDACIGKSLVLTRSRIKSVEKELIVIASTAPPRLSMSAAWHGRPQWCTWAYTDFIEILSDCGGYVRRMTAPTTIHRVTHTTSPRPVDAPLELLRSYEKVAPLCVRVDKRSFLTGIEMELLLVYRLHGAFVQEECCVCYSDFYPWETKPLAESCKEVSTLVKTPCDHAVCTQCLAVIATTWHHHPIGPGSPHIRCPSEGCMIVYTTQHFRSILTGDDYTRLKLRALLYGSPLVEVPCATCNVVCGIERRRVLNAQEGTVVVRPPCCGAFCYHCLDVSVHRPPCSPPRLSTWPCASVPSTHRPPPTPIARTSSGGIVSHAFTVT